MRTQNYNDWLNETKHSIDSTRFRPSKWENIRFARNADGAEGTITTPIGDVNKGATKYRLVFDNGDVQVLSLSNIKKKFTFDY